MASAEYMRTYTKTWREKHPERHAEIARKARLKRKYGLTPEQYDEILTRQGGVCGICGQLDPLRPRLSVDHDHKTRKVRGLLCTTCNRAIGLLKDNPGIADSAAHYLTGA